MKDSEIKYVIYEIKRDEEGYTDDTFLAFRKP